MRSYGAAIPTGQCPRCLQPVPASLLRCPRCGNQVPTGLRKISLYIGVIGLLALVFVIGLMVVVIRDEEFMNTPAESAEPADQSPPLPEAPGKLSK